MSSISALLGNGSPSHHRLAVSHMTVQLLPLSCFVDLTCNATRAASVKASFTPRFFMAEHSGVKR